jgi:nucleoside-diphosphate-sugar epimerase
MRVFGVDSLSQAYDVRMKEYRLTRLRRTQTFTFCARILLIRGSSHSCRQSYRQLYAVVNLAAIAGACQHKDPWSYLYTNTLGTLNMLEFCVRPG